MAADAGYGRALPRTRIAATMLLTDESGRVLVVKGWELPGGAVEYGESPRQAAVREIAEELHLDREPARLLAVDYVPAASSSAGSEGVVTVFDGGVVTAADPLCVPADELSELAFIEPPLLDEYLPPLQGPACHRGTEGPHSGPHPLPRGRPATTLGGRCL